MPVLPQFNLNLPSTQTHYSRFPNSAPTFGFSGFPPHRPSFYQQNQPLFGFNSQQNINNFLPPTQWGGEPSSLGPIQRPLYQRSTVPKPMFESNRKRKDWHSFVKMEIRNYIVHKLVTSLCPSPSPKAVQDHRMNALVSFARKVEGELYDSANTKEEYFRMFSEKVVQFQKQLGEWRNGRR